MNKYEKALNNIKEFCKKDKVWGCDIEENNANLDTLQECINKLEVLTSIIKQSPLFVESLNIYYQDKGELLSIELSKVYVDLESKKIEGKYWYTTYNNIMTYAIVKFTFDQFGKTWWLKKPKGKK